MKLYLDENLSQRLLPLLLPAFNARTLTIAELLLENFEQIEDFFNDPVERLLVVP